MFNTSNNIGLYNVCTKISNGASIAFWLAIWTLPMPFYKFLDLPKYSLPIFTMQIMNNPFNLPLTYIPLLLCLPNFLRSHCPKSSITFTISVIIFSTTRITFYKTALRIRLNKFVSKMLIFISLICNSKLIDLLW